MSKFPAVPAAQRAAKDAYDGGGQQWSDGHQQQKQRTKLPADEARLFFIAVNHVNAFHQKLHHLGAGQERAHPADEGDFPGVGTALDEELGHDLLAAGRQKARQVSDQVEEAGFAADFAVGDAYGGKQYRKKRQK